jgi:glutamate/tyrosine decarboxylase-like PLP-dependent enzyme
MKNQDPALHIPDSDFREIGHWLVDQVADHFDGLRDKKVTPGQTPKQVREALGRDSFPEAGMSAEEVVKRATSLLMSNSLMDGHPRFWGYIIGSGTQIGTLADMLAATINPNAGGWELAPMAIEIEKQTIGWIAEWIDYPADSGGILVSGGAMANYVGFLTAKTVKAPWEIRSKGMLGGPQMKLYCSEETHTWVQKAADLFGLGTDAIEWIPTADDLKMDLVELERRVERDKAAGQFPFLVIATAGTVSTGTVDDLREASNLCKRHDLWFHVDGAYGGPAAHLPQCKDLFDGIVEADSIALDPHKWFYCPQEAGCALLKNKQHLLDTFSYRPPYYHFEEFEDEPGTNFYEYGMQNSRGFRALKVWMGLMQAGKSGMSEMISHDIEMAQLLYKLVDEALDFEAYQTNLSITTFRYIPDSKLTEEDLNAFNEKLMVRIQAGGEAFVTNAVIEGRYLMRACFVNFRTTSEDVEGFLDVVRASSRQL